MKSISQYLYESSYDTKTITFDLDGTEDIDKFKDDLTPVVIKLCRKCHGSFEDWELSDDKKVLKMVVFFNADDYWHDFIELFLNEVSENYPDWSDKINKLG